MQLNVWTLKYKLLWRIAFCYNGNALELYCFIVMELPYITNRFTLHSDKGIVLIYNTKITLLLLNEYPNTEG